jgi:DNA-binding transcriptional regulator YiaG
MNIELEINALPPHLGNKWDGDRIRHLRCRLGWSQADMARRLGCRQQTVSEWETNVYQPQNAYSKLLDMMLNDVDAYAHQITQGPLTEMVMRDRGIAQVGSGDLQMPSLKTPLPSIK